MTATTWFGLLREMHAAGWRHDIEPIYNPGAEQPTCLEHRWFRNREGLALTVNAQTRQVEADLSYWPSRDPVHIPTSVAVERGPAWMREAMVLAGILPGPSRQWRQYTVEATGGAGDVLGAYVLCRSDDMCEWMAERPRRDTYLQLGEAVDAAQAHADWHVQMEAEDKAADEVRR